jgi:hypothetical protein
MRFIRHGHVAHRIQSEIDFLERQAVTIPAKHWEAFEVWAHRPAQKIAALRKVLRTPPKWQK